VVCDQEEGIASNVSHLDAHWMRESAVGLANAQKADNLVVRVGRICSQDTCPFQPVSGGELFSAVPLADSGEFAHTRLKYWY